MSNTMYLPLSAVCCWLLCSTKFHLCLSWKSCCWYSLALWLLIQQLCGCWYSSSVVADTAALWVLIQQLCGCWYSSSVVLIQQLCFCWYSNSVVARTAARHFPARLCSCTPLNLLKAKCTPVNLRIQLQGRSFYLMREREGFLINRFCEGITCARVHLTCASTFLASKTRMRKRIWAVREGFLVSWSTIEQANESRHNAWPCTLLYQRPWGCLCHPIPPDLYSYPYVISEIKYLCHVILRSSIQVMHVYKSQTSCTPDQNLN